jgi:hypothetical protein
MSNHQPIRPTRRSLLTAGAAIGSSMLFGGCTFTKPAAPKTDFYAWHKSLLAYLQTLSRPDGGYAWADQDRSHLTPTYAVIGCYRLLKQDIPNRERLADFIRQNHPSRLKKLEQERRAFTFQQVQALLWLGDDAADFRDRILAWNQPLPYLRQYERHGYPVFASEISGAIVCRELLGLPLGDVPSPFIEYLDARRRPNGSFNNTPAADGGDGHVVNTYWGLRALRALGRAYEKRPETLQWLENCRAPKYGFTYQPSPPFAGVDDIAYMRAAVLALELLDTEPKKWLECVGYIFGLLNPDGGFSDRYGWLSNPLATYYALDALSGLNALQQISVDVPSPGAPPPPLPSGLKVFSAQFEAHGQGSPTDAVNLAAALRIHLWGAKNAQPEWIAAAQSIADARKIPLRFFTSNEEYGTWVDIPGLGTYSHTSDIIAPAGADIGPSLAGQRAVSWSEFKERRLAPLEKAAGRLIWQFGENEELVRMFLDDALANPSSSKIGYAAISTFHFGNPDFTNSEPFLNRWRGQLPFIALQDAHGPEPWWFADMTTGFRTLFLATEPTWDGLLLALKNNWTVAVRHDAPSGHKTWMHAGSDLVLDFVRQHESDWRWWDNPAIHRPMVSIAAIRPDDPFEAPRPDRGITLRVRCAWENTNQGLLRAPITELVKLSIDGTPVAPTLVFPKAARNSLLSDHYHHFHLDTPTPGFHTAEAVVRNRVDKSETKHSIQFTV